MVGRGLGEAIPGRRGWGGGSRGGEEMEGKPCGSGRDGGRHSRSGIWEPLLHWGAPMLLAGAGDRN